MRGFTILYLVLAVGLSLDGMPITFDFNRYLYSDVGWAITVDRLLDDGLIPTKDFAYCYGLLTLVVNRSAFALFGADPHVIGWLFVCGSLLVAVAAATLLRVLEVGARGRLVAVLLLPLMVDPSTYPSPAHALEPALLLFAVAAQASGRLGIALALTTLAVFVKPGMGYLLGAVLLVETIALTPIRSWWRRLVPAAVVAGSVSVGLVIAFGWEPLANTMIPTESRKLYQDQNCGFFHGDGQVFWKPPPVRPALYYVFTPAGVWLLASVVVAAGGLVAAVRWRRDSAARVAVLMAWLHFTFVVFLFGNRYAWSYYPWMPCLGAAVVLDRLPRWSAFRGMASVAWVIVVTIGLLAVAHSTIHVFRLQTVWRTVKRDPRIDGFYSTPQVATAWQQVRKRADDGGVFILSRAGCAWYFAAGVESPSVWYLNRAVATPAEWERVRAGIARNRWLLVPDWFDTDLLSWPELADVLAPFRKADRGPGFNWYRRVESPGR